MTVVYFDKSLLLSGVGSLLQRLGRASAQAIYRTSMQLATTIPRVLPHFVFVLVVCVSIGYRSDTIDIVYRPDFFLYSNNRSILVYWGWYSVTLDGTDHRPLDTWVVSPVGLTYRRLAGVLSVFPVPCTN